MTMVRERVAVSNISVRTVVPAPVRKEMRYDTVVKSGPHEEGPPSKETIALLALLKTFAKLPDNWNGYDGTPFDDEDIEIGRCVLHALDDPVTVQRISPGPSGELELSFEYNSAQVTLLADYINLRWVVRPDDGGETRHYNTEHTGRSMWRAVDEGLERIR